MFRFWYGYTILQPYIQLGRKHKKRFMVVEKLTACLFLVLVTVDTGITLWEMYCIENLFEEPILKQICRLFSAILNKKSFK